MECPKCQFENSNSAKFCNRCGARLEAVCPECGYVNRADSNYCSECGKNLGPLKDNDQVDYNKPSSYTPKFLIEKILNSKGSVEGERKVVTVLSADVVHYTEMSEKLDPEDVHTIMDGCFRLLMNEIHKYEGTINQFLGDGIMAIFGAPIAYEDHARRACRAALEVQKALKVYHKRVRKKHGIDFKMRIGINTGNVVVGSIGDDLRMDYTATADATNIACLLQQVAKPGHVVISGSTHRMIRGYFDCDKLGEEKLKHRKEPVKYCELQHERTKRSRLDIEEEERSLTRFVNRKEELAIFLELFERVKKREGQIICVVGEAGEGKSRLIYEFKRHIKSKEATYLESQCISYGKSVPYYPVVEILKKSFGISDNDNQEQIRRILEINIKRLDKKLSSSIPVLFRLLSLETENEPLEAKDPDQVQDKAFEALRLMILSGSQEKPLIVVVENLQWIDSASEEFLSYIAESIASFPVFLILSYRLGYGHPFGSKSYLTQISLSRLPEKECTRIIQALLPDHRLPYDFINLILSKAEGNPLFVEEIVASLLEREIILDDSIGYKLSRDIEDIEIPETIQEIVLARVDRLAEKSKMTIQAASVIGREFTLKLLARKEELERELEQHIGELKQVELVQEKTFFPDIEYMFKHAVTKDVIYNSLLFKQRKELHRKIAEAIERLYWEKKEDYLEMLAYHYLHSDAIDKSVSYLIEAGMKAKSLYANKEAIKYFRKSMDIMTHHEGSWEGYKKKAHRELADLYDLVGDYQEAIHQYREEIKYTPSSTEKAENLRRIGIIFEKKGDLEEALSHYEKAIDLAVPQENPLAAGRIYMNIGWIHNRNGNYQKAIDFCNRALGIFKDEKNEYEIASALNNLAVIHEFHGQWDLAEKCNRDSIRLIKRVGDERKTGSFYISLGLLNWKKGKTKKAKEYFKKSLAVMESTGHTLGIANCLLNLGRVNTSAGNMRKALSYLEESMALFQKMGSKSKICQNFAALAETHLRKGQLEKAKDHCSAGMEIAVDTPYLFDQGKIHLILGEIEAKENGDAEKHFQKGIDIFGSLGRKYEMAQAMEKFGQHKIEKGDKKAGQKYLKNAGVIFRELGISK